MNNLDQKDQADLDEIREFYESVYYKDATVATPSSHEVRLVKSLGIQAGDAVLDVACGLGEWLKACQDAGATPAGVDLSDKAIGICKKNMPDGEFYAQAAEELPFADNRFDMVTCLGSLEHFVRPVQAMQEMSRVAKDSARFILLVPNADFLTRKLGLFGGTYQVDAKEVVRTLDEWNDLFNQAGLTVEKRWKDLHVISWRWVKKGKWFMIPVRFVQALMLFFWPLRWQYQVYHLCRKSAGR